MGMRKEYVSKKAHFGDIDCEGYASSIFNDINNDPDSLVNPHIVIPEGDILFSDGRMDFAINLSEGQKARFRERFFPVCGSVGSVYFKKKIESEGTPLEYSVRFDYNSRNENKINLVLVMPKPVAKKLKPEEMADGYRYHELGQSYEGIEFDKALMIGLDVKKDAEETFGFEKINLGGALKTEKIINICVRPKEVDKEGFFYVVERSLDHGAQLQIDRKWKEYGERFPAKAEWAVSMKKDKGTIATGYARLNRKAMKYHSRMANDSLDLFLEEIPEEANIKYGCYEMTDFGIKLADAGKKAIGLVLTPLGLVAWPFAKAKDSIYGAIESYKRDKRLAARIREDLITEYIKKEGIPQNRDFGESCLIGLTPVALEEIDAEAEKRFKVERENRKKKPSMQ